MTQSITTAVIVASVALSSLFVTRSVSQAIELSRREQREQQASLEARLKTLQRAQGALEERIVALQASGCPAESQQAELVPSAMPTPTRGAGSLAPAPVAEADSEAAPASHDSQAALAAARTKLDTAIAARVWRTEDVAEMRGLTAGLDAAERDALLRQLIVALNDRHIKAEFRGPPF